MCVRFLVLCNRLVQLVPGANLSGFPTSLAASESWSHVRQKTKNFDSHGHLFHDALLRIPVLSSLPRNHNNPLAKCGCKKHCIDFHGDHTSTCTAHSGATKAHGSKNHRIQGSRLQYMRDQAGSRRSWSSTCPSHTTATAPAATCSRTGCYRIPRTSMPVCVLLRSAK